MSAIELLNNIFFGFFFALGDYLLPVFAFLLFLILIGNFLKFFKD